MLVPIQTSGKKPPLFFVHGLHGIMWLGATLARGLGQDQPLYAIHANLPGPRVVVVLPYDHTRLLRAGREHLARAIKFLIDEGPELEKAAQQQFVPAFA